MLKNKTTSILILASGFIGLSIVVSAYYYSRIYESPEECFVREIVETADEEGHQLLANKFTEQSNQELSVASAKAYLSEASNNDPFRITIKTYLDYCNVK